MLPEKFIQRIKIQGLTDTDSLIKAFEEPSPASIRINTLKWNSIPVNSEPVAWCRDGFYLEKRPLFTLDPLFHAGCYYPQEASGMFMEQVYKQTIGKAGNIRILDLCGAPGGKSTHLSSLAGKNGMLVANEVIRTRASVLAENITKWGLSNTVVTRSDPSAFKNLPGYFDMILVDAPCSGEGMFRNRKAVDEWSEKNTALCSVRQKRILLDVWPALKENGILIYSTCTFNPDENEKNIKWLSDNRKAECIRIDISDYRGISEIDYEGIYGYGFYPGRIRGEGLFISVLRKRENHGKSNARATSSRFTNITREEAGIAEKWSLFPAGSLVKSDGSVYSLPVLREEYQRLSENLLIVKPGTQIFTVKKKNILPSHELAMSVYFRNGVFPTLNLTPEQALDYLRRESITATNAPDGWILACYNGINMGFMNNIGSRINNYYPVEWRIRMRIPEKDNEIVIKWHND
jgi:16S rRNA C967 or C1407 C5-methylase (RsmB/RsmF family)/NOL1/NOP2/fmu family ribosome biogenesis protein